MKICTDCSSYRWNPIPSLVVRTSQDVEPRGVDPVIATCLVVLVLFAWTIVSIPAGMKWGRFFHWTGEGLLVLGVLLAAQGISDVRRQWTQQLGIWGSAKKRTRRVVEKGAELFWLYKNRFIEKLPMGVVHALGVDAPVVTEGHADVGRLRIHINVIVERFLGLQQVAAVLRLRTSDRQDGAYEHAENERPLDHRKSSEIGRCAHSRGRVRNEQLASRLR
jgi:hypothetical protein